ncbi:MAG: secretin and TonB N-terminal domain-containing protein [Candidatus Gastranaerophilales bacterium]|nr:secretin and TonB N-terminal domain-containing protein [Candidatus Gastranaerophilales bacterium]
MQKFRPGNIGKICLSLLSLSLLTQTVFGYDENKITYLDSVSSSYLNTPEKSIIDMNSFDARGVEATLKLDAIPIISNSGSRINLSLRDSDLKQTLRMIADKGGLNIVFDKSVEGKITLDLNNVTINDAFIIIFKSAQLTYTLDGNTINVMTLEAAKNLAYTQQTMTVIPVKYVSAENIANFLNGNIFNSKIFGLSTKNIVTANPTTNQLIVFGTSTDVQAIKRILPMIDTKPMVNSFKVNHTTPEEMANLLCQSILYTPGAAGGAQQGGASGGGGGNSSDDRIALGEGRIACRSTADLSPNTSITSFLNTPLTVAYFPELGKINTYGGSVEQIEVIRDFIKEHDKKQLMAYIELSVIELNETGSKDFSNTWNLWTPFISLGFDQTNGLTTSSPFFIWGDEGKATVTNTTAGTGGTTTSTSQETVTKSNNSALIYQLKYLVENGNGRVLTNPKIMVTNGKTATIDMTSDYVKSVTSQILQGSDTVTSATQKTYDIGSDEGLLIEIIPFISPDGYVSMNITPEFATIKSQVFAVGSTGQNELAATLLQRRDLELKNIRIKDGETLVLAGLIKETETQSVKKMPILSDLPFIGAFFRSNAANKSREELVIVVTPHIVKDSQDIMDEQIYDL